jgi:hypothetical protein
MGGISGIRDRFTIRYSFVLIIESNTQHFSQIYFFIFYYLFFFSFFFQAEKTLQAELVAVECEVTYSISRVLLAHVIGATYCTRNISNQ